MIEITNFDGTRVEKVLTNEDKTEKIWENASPTSSFPGQQIMLPDIKEGDIVIVEHKFATEDTSYILSAVVVREASTITLNHIIFDNDQYVYVNFRDCAIYADTKTISFAGGKFRIFSQNSVGSDNTRAIPTRVFLIQNNSI